MKHILILEYMWINMLIGFSIHKNKKNTYDKAKKHATPLMEIIRVVLRAGFEPANPCGKGFPIGRLWSKRRS
jgi:hypothetical protein